MAQDKRRETRQSIRIPCWLLARQGEPPIEGWLRDVSRSGARVVTASADLALPEQFTLALTADLKVRRVCQLAWSRGNQLGVRFAVPVDAGSGRQ